MDDGRCWPTSVDIREVIPPVLLAALFASNVAHAKRPLAVLAAVVLALGIGAFLWVARSVIWAAATAVLAVAYRIPRRTGRDRYEDEAERFKFLLADLGQTIST